MNAFLSIITLSYKECVFYNCRTKVNSAYAGNTCQNWQSRGQQRDYPRLRGEYAGRPLMSANTSGSPPLARGILKTMHRTATGTGITPARGGNTDLRFQKNRRKRDHPRSRGEYRLLYNLPSGFQGSPPLARGIRCQLAIGLRRIGITHARAGNTH